MGALGDFAVPLLQLLLLPLVAVFGLLLHVLSTLSDGACGSRLHVRARASLTRAQRGGRGAQRCLDAASAWARPSRSSSRARLPASARRLRCTTPSRASRWR
jgi:hypothetical protein